MRSAINTNHFLFISNDKHRKKGGDFDVRAHKYEVIVKFPFWMNLFPSLTMNLRKKEISWSSNTLRIIFTTYDLTQMMIIIYLQMIQKRFSETIMMSEHINIRIQKITGGLLRLSKIIFIILNFTKTKIISYSSLTTDRMLISKILTSEYIIK